MGLMFGNENTSGSFVRRGRPNVFEFHSEYRVRLSGHRRRVGSGSSQGTRGDSGGLGSWSHRPESPEQGSGGSLGEDGGRLLDQLGWKAYSGVVWLGEGPHRHRCSRPRQGAVGPATPS